MSEIADAIHADAEAAREEIRAAGIVCPSCGVNMADLPWDHRLLFNGEPTITFPATAECADGKPVDLAATGYGTVKAAVSVAFWGEMNAAMDAEFSRALGWDIRGPAPAANFTGFLGMLGQQ